MEKKYIVRLSEEERKVLSEVIRTLSIAENELSSLTRQCVAKRRIGDIETLQEEITAWGDDVNDSQRGVDWQMKIDDARTKLKSVYPKIKL